MLFTRPEEDVQCSEAAIELPDIVKKKSCKAKEGKGKGKGGAAKPKPRRTKKTVSTVAAEQDAAVTSGSGVGSVGAMEVPSASTSIQQPTPAVLPAEDTLPALSTQNVPSVQATPPTEDTPSTPPTEDALHPPTHPHSGHPSHTDRGFCWGEPLDNPICPGPSTGDKRKGHPVKAGSSNPDKHRRRDKTEAQFPYAIEDEEEPQGKGKSKSKGKGKDKKGLGGLPPPPAEKRNTRSSHSPVHAGV
ncbi:hypothetical protein WOLCODRAFT_21557 [Wolfiporia cocos MD-104 SS10]|uniref:Uncharacterized protein n=1 Tax=Wolfiporia cocos (strain MD-104) TaxID=742152 RepID=A0A2H3JU35_WOLCO|nr:hypothetical protein WOLCODRAFT_21557 [Wolfiporia cocos MD-104 SS10]